jgi:O-antigen chain-terminating methyltransferase
VADGRDPGPPSLERFLDEPTRDLKDWRWLWQGDHAFPTRSHRGLLGRLLVFGKRLLRPLVKTPQNDLWERQRVFNLIQIELLERALALYPRVEHLEAFLKEGLDEVMRHNDALYWRVDQKLDRYRRESRDLVSTLGAALEATAPGEGDAAAIPTTLKRALDERGYLELEHRYRGTDEDIRERLSLYLADLQERTPVLDLGCGRGEFLRLLQDKGIEGRGIDGNARMVAACREQGLAVEEGDLFEALAAQPEGSLGAVVSFHVIEHLPAENLERLVRLAWRALRPGGILILETPNPLSVVVAARNFWLDPTHLRPVHPESLRLAYELAGFDPVEFRPLRPFSPEERLPEIDLSRLPAEQHDLADRVNRLRDQLDEVLFGEQDYALLGVKALPQPQG